MGNAQKRQGKKRSGGFLANWFSSPHQGSVCQACGRPHVEGMQPEPDYRFGLGNIEVQVFETRHFGKLNFEVKVQCLKLYRDRWYRRELISFQEFEHLAFLVNKALRLMHEKRKESNPFSTR